MPPLFFLYALILAAALVLAGLILLRRWQSRRALVARLAELSVFADMGREITGAQLDLQRLAELVYQQADKIVDTSIFQLGLFEADRYQLLIWTVDGQRQPLAEFRLTADALGIVGWVRESRQSLLIQDFELEHDSLPAQPRYSSSNPPASAVFVPLMVGDKVLGAIAIQSRRSHAFTEEHLRLLTIVANHAAAALENGRLYEQARRKAAQLQALADISQRLNAIQSLPALYQQTVSLAAERFEGCAVSFFAGAGAGELRLAATTRPADSERRGEEVVGRAASGRRALVTQRLESDEAQPGRPPELAVPVEINNRLLGVLHVESCGGAFDEDDLSIFKSLAAQMAVAILEGQTYEAEHRRSEHLAALAQASRVMASTLELDDLLDELLELTEERFGYHQAHVFLLQDQRLFFRAGTGRSAGRWAVEGFSLALDSPTVIAQAGRAQQPILVPDTADYPGYVFAPYLADMRAEMAVPLAMGSQLLGVFDVQSEQAGAFSPADLQTLQTVADTLAVAVRNARLFEAERRRRRLAEIMREVATALASTLSLDGVLSQILDGLARVVNYDAASILLVNDLGELQLRATRGVPDADEVIGLALEVYLFPPDDALPALVPFGQVDYRNEYHDLLALPEPHACLGAVLALQNEHLGYLVVDLAGRDEFPAEDVEMITAFASQAALAIENARRYTAQREQAWISTALLQVADATARSSDLAEVFDTVTRLTPMLVGVDRCAILQAQDDALVMQAYHAADEASALPAPVSLQPGQWPRFAELVSTLEPVVIDPEDEMPEACRELFGGVVILLPLLAKGRLAGALMVGQAPGDRPFTAHRIRLLGGIANQAALAVESVMLYRAQQEEAWVSTALLQVAQAVAGQPTLDEALETVARLTPMLVGMERVAIYQWDAGQRLFRASQVMGAAAQPAAFDARADEINVDITEPAALAFPCQLPERLAQVFGVSTCLVWPLWARGDLLGALVVEQVGELGRRLNILNGIAHQLSLTMESARLAREVAQQERLERELEVGRDIQASFLPKTCPVVTGWDVSAYWRSARQVGGDFYDFIPLRSEHGAERWGVVIADVADKGVPAALFMALSRTLLRSAAIGRVSPANTLERVNRLILADVHSDLFVTVFYGVWEPNTGRLRYALAGHNPPAWISRNGQMRLLKGRGAALGVLEKVQFEEHEIELQVGDLVVLYTDGVTDAVDAEAREFGMPRLVEVARRARVRPAGQIVDTVIQAVDEHTGAEPAFDDLTLVALKRTH